MFKRSRRGKAFTVVAAAGALSVVLAACGGSDDSGSGDSAAEDTATEETTEEVTEEAAGGTVAVSLITKDSTNPFFVAMQQGAQQAADEVGVAVNLDLKTTKDKQSTCSRGKK